MPNSSSIHPAAIIEEGAKIGNNVTIEAYAVIKGTVTLHDNVVIKSHAYIDGYTTIGEGTVVWPSASIGTKTQDLKFRGEKTFVKIGKNCEIREFCTINSSCQENSVVKVGDHCLIMAYCHVAHHCEIGDRVIMANGVNLAGHVIVEDFANIGGMTPIHQHCRIGQHSMVGGLSRITHDVPPYTIGAGVPYKIGGLNLVGLKRRGFSLEERKNLTKAFRSVYRSELSLDEALSQLSEEFPESPHVQHWVNFCKSSKRGLISHQSLSADMQGDLLESEEILEEV